MKYVLPSSFVIIVSLIFSTYSLGQDKQSEIIDKEFNLPSLGDPILLAEADDDAESKKETKADSEVCRRYAADIDAKVSDIVKAGCEPTLAQMSKLMDNPVGNVAMLFTQFDWTRLKNGDNKLTGNQGVYTGILQFPKPVSENWNLISRVVWTVPSVPVDQDKIDDFTDDLSGGFPPGGGPLTPPDRPLAPIDVFDGRTTAFGDMYYVGLFSPKEPIKLDNGANFVWGLGFDLAFPTAQEDIVGSGKYSAGPSALAVYLGETFKGGALVQHYWDYASRDSDRDDVNLTNIQSIYYWSLNPTTSIGAGPNIIMNWEQDSDNFLTLPIGTGISKTLQFGKLPVRVGAEIHYSLIRPDDEVGADWNFRFYIIPAVPSAFIPILN